MGGLRDNILIIREVHAPCLKLSLQETLHFRSTLSKNLYINICKNKKIHLAHIPYCRERRVTKS